MTHRPSLPPSAPAAAAARHVPSVLVALSALSVAVLGSAVLAACGGGDGNGGAVAEAAASANELVQPMEIRPDSGGVLTATLMATVQTLSVPSASGSTQEVLRTYQVLQANGIDYSDSSKYGFPGPTFRVRQGDSINITLINSLPTDTAGCESYPATTAANPPVDTMEDCFHGPNSTNIHFHGFHVSPNSPADNVLMTIAPGDTFVYAFRIPDTQSPGTHWYHPHKHGSVALQVSNGMSGAFIVEGGGLDSLANAYRMRELLVGVQEIDTEPNLMQPGPAQAKLVNGQYAPTITMRPGEVLRMRLVNENVSATATYAILFDTSAADGPQLFDVARDGVQYAPANYDTTTPDTNLYVAPGNRLDMFVRAPGTAGSYTMLARVARDTLPQGRTQKRRTNRVLTTTQPLFHVRVADDETTYNTTLPGALPALPSYLANLDASVNTPSVNLVFTETGHPGNDTTPPSFFLGTTANPYQKFNSANMFLTMPLGATQMWQINNTSPNGINHPFHIHINPFQVVQVFAPDTSDPNYDYYQFLNQASQNGNPVWMDVIPLPLPQGDTAGYVLIRQQYNEFAGPFVMHCHILGHEERGMMQKIAIDSTTTSSATASAASSATGTRARPPQTARAGGGGSGRAGGAGGGGAHGAHGADAHSH